MPLKLSEQNEPSLAQKDSNETKDFNTAYHSPAISDITLKEGNLLEPNNHFEESNSQWLEEEDTLPLVLIVEDNNDVRTYLKGELGTNYRITESTNGIDGLEKAFETIPDLIISDIMMPGMDGIALCKKMKTDERTCHIPVILLTARQSDEYKIEGYETGADAYISKPFNTEILVIACI